MGRTRYIESHLRTLENNLLICLYKYPKETLEPTDSELKRKILDLLLMTKNYWQIGDGCIYRQNVREEFPYVRVEKEKHTELISLLAKEIGIIKGTLSIWMPAQSELEALTQGDLSQLASLNLGDRIDWESLKPIIGKTPGLKYLRIKTPISFKKDLFLQFISQCPLLKTLCLSPYSLREGILSELLPVLSHLNVLKINNTSLSEEDFQILKDKVVSGSLHTLAFSKLRMPRKECWAELIEAGKDKLQGIDFKNILSSYYDQSMTEPRNRFFKALTTCTNLRQLHLNIGPLHQFTDDTFRILLQNNSNLDEIRASYLPNLTDTALDHMAAYGPNLKRIDLYYTAMTREKIDHFACQDFWKRPTSEFIKISGERVNLPQDNPCLKGGNDYCYVRNDKLLEFELLNSHRSYWDPRFARV